MKGELRRRQKQLAEQMQATQAILEPPVDPEESDPCEAERQELLAAQLNLLAAEVATLLAQLKVDSAQTKLETCEMNNSEPPAAP